MISERDVQTAIFKFWSLSGVEIWDLNTDTQTFKIVFPNPFDEDTEMYYWLNDAGEIEGIAGFNETLED